jgi:Na+/melibiose symporter-like transporter
MKNLFKSKKGQWYVGIQIMFGVLIFLSIIGLIFVTVTLMSVKDELNNQAKTITALQNETTRTLNQINNSLQTIQNLDANIKSIDARMNSVENNSKFNVAQLEDLQKMRLDLNSARDNLTNMMLSYKPTISYYLTNISQDNVNAAFTSNINHENYVFSINFVFGALFGSLFSVSLYFVLKMMNKKEDK